MLTGNFFFGGGGKEVMILLCRYMGRCIFEGLLCNVMPIDRFHRKDVLDLQWSKDGVFLITGSVDNSCIIWDADKGTGMK